MNKPQFAISSFEPAQVTGPSPMTDVTFPVGIKLPQIEVKFQLFEYGEIVAYTEPIIWIHGDGAVSAKRVLENIYEMWPTFQQLHVEISKAADFTKGAP